MRGNSVVLSLLLAANVSWLGCAQPRAQSESEKAAQRSAPPDFTLAVRMVRADQPDVGLLQRAVLRSGDRLRLSLGVRPPLRLYLHVGQMGASRTPAILHPDAAPDGVAVEPTSGELSLPHDATYQVVGAPGEEVFAVVATRQALDRTQQMEALRAALLPSLRDRDPPPTSGVRDRGEVVPGWLDNSGRGEARFVLSHQ